MQFPRQTEDVAPPPPTLTGSFRVHPEPMKPEERMLVRFTHDLVFPLPLKMMSDINGHIYIAHYTGHGKSKLVFCLSSGHPPLGPLHNHVLKMTAPSHGMDKEIQGLPHARHSRRSTDIT